MGPWPLDTSVPQIINDIESKKFIASTLQAAEKSVYWNINLSWAEHSQEGPIYITHQRQAKEE